jgi:hypothetical protein
MNLHWNVGGAARIGTGDGGFAEGFLSCGFVLLSGVWVFPVLPWHLGAGGLKSDWSLLAKVPKWIVGAQPTRDPVFEHYACNVSPESTLR